jgi:hypothetical protein
MDLTLDLHYHNIHQLLNKPILIPFIEIHIMLHKNKMHAQKQLHNLIELEILQEIIIQQNNRQSEIYQL